MSTLKRAVVNFPFFKQFVQKKMHSAAPVLNAYVLMAASPVWILISHHPKDNCTCRKPETDLLKKARA